MGYQTAPELIGIEYINEDSSTQVNAGADNTISIEPDPGYIYQIISIYYKAVDPVGSTAGTHDVEIRSESGYCSYALVKANTGSDVAIIRGVFYGDSTEAPSGTAEQFKICQGQIWIGNGESLDFIYSNDTDANQTGTRNLRLLVKKYRARA
jgi:hypothetical protein